MYITPSINTGIECSKQKQMPIHMHTHTLYCISDMLYIVVSLCADCMYSTINPMNRTDIYFESNAPHFCGVCECVCVYHFSVFICLDIPIHTSILSVALSLPFPPECGVCCDEYIFLLQRYEQYVIIPKFKSIVRR